MSITKWRVDGCSDDSPERGAFRKRRGKGQELALFAKSAIEFGVGYPRLRTQSEIVRLEGEQAIHSRKIESKIITVRRHADMQMRSAAGGNQCEPLG